MKIVTAEQMRQIDRTCNEQGIPVHVLMENAGKAVAEETRAVLGPLKQHRILCLAGAGNNGGDGLVAARYLHDWGAVVSVYLASSRPEGDANLALLLERNVPCFKADADTDFTWFTESLNRATCVIDGLLGTGKMRPLTGVFKTVLETVQTEKQQRPLTIVAIDMPSGMDADTGACDAACPDADVTVTLGFPKPGLFGFPGAERAGKLVVADIGIPAELADESTLELMNAVWAAATLPRRPMYANKGTFGKVLVTAGSVNYTGAAFLASSGVLRVGAGLVTLATAASLHPVIAAALPEVTHLPLPESPVGHIAAEAAPVIYAECSRYSTILIGCGLGQAPPTAECIRALLQRCPQLPAVIDADGLNILATVPGWYHTVVADTVITPHPGEMSRLTGRPVPDIQADRIAVARHYAAVWNKTVVLKGAFTVVAAPDGRCRISPFANPGMASGGTGDVLAGIIAGLAAQGLAIFDAASLGVYLHGAAGERVSAEMGDAGMLASDLLPVLPLVIRDLKTSPRTGNE